MKIYKIETPFVNFQESSLTVTEHSFSFEEYKNYLPYLFYFNEQNALQFLSILKKHLRKHSEIAIKIPKKGSYYVFIGIPGDFETLTLREIKTTIDASYLSKNYIFSTEKEAANFIRNIKIFIRKYYNGPNFKFNINL